METFGGPIPDKTMRILNILVFLLLVLGFGLRMYDLTDQPIDFHPTRQLRGALIARGMFFQMVSPVNDETRKLAVAFMNSTGQYEPPILERLVAWTYLLMPGDPMQRGQSFWVARIYNSLFWMIAGLALFALARRLATPVPNSPQAGYSSLAANLAALFSLAYFLVLPFGVQASRSFQPDPGMTMWIVLYAYALYRWSEGQSWKWAVLAGLFGGIAILVKAVALYIVAGAGLAMVIALFGRQILKLLRSPQVWVIAILCLTPTFLFYIRQSGRASVYFSSWTVALSHLLLERSTYIRWLIMLINLMGWAALLVSLAGVMLAKSRNRALLIGLGGGYIIYGLTLPYQMYTHTYYHIQLIPVLALAMAPAAAFVIQRILQTQFKIWYTLLAAAVLGWMVFSAWKAVELLHSQDFRKEPAYWQEITSFLPTGGKIIGLTQDYGFRLMFYGWRKVVLWPSRGEINLSILRGSSKQFQAFFK